MVIIAVASLCYTFQCFYCFNIKIVIILWICFLTCLFVDLRRQSIKDELLVNGSRCDIYTELIKDSSNSIHSLSIHNYDKWILWILALIFNKCFDLKHDLMRSCAHIMAIWSDLLIQLSRKTIESKNNDN